MQLNEPGKQIQDITPDGGIRQPKRGDILANLRFQRSQLWQLALGSQLRRPKILSAVSFSEKDGTEIYNNRVL